MNEWSDSQGDADEDAADVAFLHLAKLGRNE
jgi:hypothetical protein